MLICAKWGIVHEFRIESATVPGVCVRRNALPLGKAGTLRELGIWGNGPDIRVGTGTKGVIAGAAGMGVRMGITDMADRFGMEPIPEQNQGQIIWDHFYVIYWYKCVKDQKLRKTLIKYRLSDHCLAIERGWHRQRWQSREQRLCSLCAQKKLETEEHFLLHCDYYHNIRAAYFPKFQQIKPNFMALPNAEKLSHILGENSKMITTAASYVSACHKLRLSARAQNRSKILSCMLYKVFFFFL